MIPSIQKSFLALVISLAIQVISLSGIACASVAYNTTLSGVVQTPARITFESYSAAMPTGKGCNYYVSDPRSNGVHKLNKYGLLEQTITTPVIPRGVAIGGGSGGSTTGKLLIAQGSYVSVRDTSTGEETAQIRNETPLADVMLESIAVDPATGLIFVADSKWKWIKVYDKDGTFKTVNYVSSLFTQLAGMAFFVNTAGTTKYLIATDDARGLANYFTVNTSNGVITFDAQYTVGTSINGVTVQSGSGFRRAYYVDVFQSNVKVYDAEARTLIETFSRYGSAAGQLEVPTDLVYDSQTKVLLINNGFGNIVVYGVDGNTMPSALAKPSLNVNAVTTPVSTATINLSGTTDVGATVKVSVNGGALQSCNVTTSSFTCSNVSLAAGKNTFLFQATNDGPNAATAGDLGEYFTYYYPALTLTANSLPTHTRSVKVLVSGTATSSDNNPTLVVTIKHRYYNPNTSAYVTESIPAGVLGTTWSALVSLDYDEAHTIWVEASNHDGNNTAATSEVEIVRDTNVPSVSVSSISSGSYTSSQVHNITGTVTDPSFDYIDVSVIIGGNTVTNRATVVTADGLAVSATNKGMFSAPLILGQGNNKITMVAYDKALNATTIERFAEFDFDTTRPTIGITSPGDGDVITNDVDGTVTISGSSTNAYTLTVAGVPVPLCEGGPCGSVGDWSAVVSLAGGMNTLEVVATSLDGKSSTVKRTVFRDGINGDAKFNLTTTAYMTDVTSKAANLNVEGTVGGSVANVMVSYDGATPSSQPVSGGNFTYTVVLGNEGAKSLVLSATSGGKTNKLIRNFVVDRTSPSLALVATEGTPAVVNGSIDAGGYSKITATVADAPAGVVAMSNAGTWNVNFGALEYTQDNMLICATDPAGNQVCYPLNYIGDGDCNLDGIVTLADTLCALRISVHIDTPTATQKSHGDITSSGDLTGGKPNPDGEIDGNDALLILKKAVGLLSW